jgi:hypothetical protein
MFHRGGFKINILINQEYEIQFFYNNRQSNSKYWFNIIDLKIVDIFGEAVPLILIIFQVLGAK